MVSGDLRERGELSGVLGILAHMSWDVTPWTSRRILEVQSVPQEFGGFRLGSFRGRLGSDGWTCGRVPTVSELYSGNIATLLPQHIGRN